MNAQSNTERPAVAAPLSSEVRYLTIPTTPPTLVPLGISRDDFQLIKSTLSLWEHRVSPFAPNDTPIEEYRGILSEPQNGAG